jgi:hypothetical protein
MDFRRTVPTIGEAEVLGVPLVSPVELWEPEDWVEVEVEVARVNKPLQMVDLLLLSQQIIMTVRQIVGLEAVERGLEQ